VAPMQRMVCVCTGVHVKACAQLQRCEHLEEMKPLPAYRQASQLAPHDPKTPECCVPDRGAPANPKDLFAHIACMVLTARCDAKACQRFQCLHSQHAAGQQQWQGSSIPTLRCSAHVCQLQAKDVSQLMLRLLLQQQPPRCLIQLFVATCNGVRVCGRSPRIPERFCTAVEASGGRRLGVGTKRSMVPRECCCADVRPMARSLMVGVCESRGWIRSCRPRFTSPSA
jgi:hypothetical protein